MYKKIGKCRICGNTNLVSVVDLGMQKMTGIFPKTYEKIEEAPLELVRCKGGVRISSTSAFLFRGYDVWGKIWI